MEIVCLLDVKKYQTAQDLLISLYAPPLIISGEFEPLSNLLSQFPATINQEIEWNRKGQILKTFVDCKLKYPDLSNTYSMLTGSERKILEEKVDSVLEDLSDSNLYLSWTLGAGTRKDQMVEENVYISVCTIVEYFLEISSLLRPSKVRMVFLIKLTFLDRYRSIMSCIYKSRYTRPKCSKGCHANLVILVST